MSSSNPSSGSEALPLPTVNPLSNGTQVVFAWAEWNKKHATSSTAKRFVVFQREGYRLLVHYYGGSLCGLLKLSPTRPKVQQFREWLQPYDVVCASLKKRGWELVLDTQTEVNYVH